MKKRNAALLALILTVVLQLLQVPASMAAGEKLQRSTPISTQTRNFFPPAASIDARRESWYLTHLQRMNESSFRLVGKNDVVYRFLWIRSFHHPICVRIIFINGGKDGSALVGKELTGGDLYGAPPAKLIKDFAWRLTPQLSQQLIQKIEASGFWTEPTAEPDFVEVEVDNPSTLHRGKKACVYKCDGAQWILEGAAQGKYHMVRRHSPKDGSVRELGLIFLQIAQLYPDGGQDVY